MPSGPRPTSRPGAGPGRGNPRARTAPRQSTAKKQRATASAQPENDYAQETEQPQSPTTGRRPSITTRAIALAVVFLVLTISYATSLRIYFSQSAAIAATEQEISQRQAHIADLRTDLRRWDDPDYVETQARDRLGWVMPGETGFRVVGDNGQPLGGGAEIQSATKPAAPPQDAWWDKLWGSVEAADQPAPVVTKPKRQPTITEKTKPSTVPSPSPTPTPR